MCLTHRLRSSGSSGCRSIACSKARHSTSGRKGLRSGRTTGRPMAELISVSSRLSTCSTIGSTPCCRREASTNCVTSASASSDRLSSVIFACGRCGCLASSRLSRSASETACSTWVGNSVRSVGARLSSAIRASPSAIRRAITVERRSDSSRPWRAVSTQRSMADAASNTASCTQRLTSELPDPTVVIVPRAYLCPAGPSAR